jgi:DNA-binding NarL/FixJ family response regulator/DNA-binding transcriptional ArsR family regulator
VLSVLGLDEGQQAVYDAVTAVPSATVTELVGATGLSARAVTSALAALRERGLVEALLGQRQQWAMTPPEPAIDALVHETQRALAQVRAHALGLAERARQQAVLGRPEELVAIAEGSAAMGAHFEQLQRGAEREVLVLDRPPYPVTGGAVANPLQAELIRNGITYRGLYDAALLSDSRWTERVQADLDEGVQGRVMEGVPLKLAVADRSMAMIPLREADAVRGMSALVVRPSVLLDSLAELFEALWQRAIPLRLDQGAVPGVDPGLVEVVRLLASGMTDAGIARQWRTSERTVRRRVAEAMQVLGATSRLQTGMLAERAGWLSDSS